MRGLFVTSVNTFKKICATLSVKDKSICQNIRPWVIVTLTALLAGTLTKESFLQSLNTIFLM